jgi:vacuolar protein sorting-associated protein 72
MYAYKEIQKLKRGEYKWSALVGAYVGPGTFAARGVPGRFLSEGAR